jgi:hypothetical protein
MMWKTFVWMIRRELPTQPERKIVVYPGRVHFPMGKEVEAVSLLAAMELLRGG